MLAESQGSLDLGQQAPLEEDRRGSAVVDLEGDLGARQSEVDRHADAPHARRSEDHFEVGHSISEQDGDPISGPQPRAPEPAGDSAHPIREVRPVQAPFLILDGGRSASQAGPMCGPLPDIVIPGSRRIRAARGSLRLHRLAGYRNPSEDARGVGFAARGGLDCGSCLSMGSAKRSANSI